MATALAGVLALAAAAATAATSELRTVDLRGLEARSAALLLSGQRTGDLEASFGALRLPASDTEEPLLLIVDLVGSSLLEAGGDDAIILEVYAYALGGGQPRATLSRAFRLDPEKHRRALETGGVKFLGRVTPPAGAGIDELRLLVLHRASGTFVLDTLELPALSAAQSGGAEPPRILESAAPWIVARDAGDPVASSFGDSLPATRLAAGDGGELRLSIIGGGPAGLTARLLDVAGEPLAELALETVTAGDGQTARDVRVDLSGHSPGEYLLALSAAAPAAAAAVLPLELLSEPIAGGDPWFRRPRAPATPPATAEVERPPARGRPAHAERALAAYQRAFEAWLAGDFAGAASELERFEAGAGGGANLSLQEGQVRAAAELASRDSEALVPLMALHERLYRLYRETERPQLATHSRRLAAQFARIYADRAGRDAGRISALVPVSLAGVQQEIGSRNAAQAAFEHALELDPRQPEALVGLAALHESFAHYETAVELLRRRARGGSLPPAARIRLAINLGRVGANRQAESHLRELLEAQPEWISRLACQELARLLAGTGRAEEALETLVAARRRYPEDQTLIIQQAALLDRLGKPLAGQRVLEALDELPAGGGDTPRLRYSELPTLEIERARGRLAGAAVERLASILEQARSLREERAP